MFNKSVKTALISTMLLSGILTACSTSNDTNKAGEAATGDQPVTIKVWGMGDQEQTLKTISEQFESDNPNIKVDVQVIPWGSAHDKLLTAVASKSGPDVLQMGTSWMPEFANAGALLDLTPYVDQYPEFKPENFFEGSVNTTQFDGKTFGIPWYAETRVLFYRTDLLKEVGYDKAPATWDELKDAATKLTARGEGKYGIDLVPGEPTLGIMFGRQNGSKIFDEQNKPLFNQPEFVDAVKYVGSFYQEKLSPVDLGIDAVQGFAGDGVIPMFISGPWMIKPIKEQAPDIEGKWATAVLPSGSANNNSILGGSDLTVFKYSKNQEAAVKFIAYMSKPEVQLKWKELSDALPAVQSVWQDASMTSDPNLQVIGEQLKHAEATPALTAYDQISQKYVAHFEQIYRANADVQKEMDALNVEAEKLIK
ncbi:sugar ABC transporter substrate-binding protein [Paenibacillus sp. KS-LC4]|uniref:sugar ABC transporter substrate-binding protein n=1 Tax=Paenibacillus sp. KS-LC4 TaxID=2979727 RepID=UPI0030D23C59